MRHLAFLAIVLTCLATVALAGDDKPWGTERTTPKNKEQVAAFFATCSQDNEKCAQNFDGMVIVGPALWARLKKADAALAEQGTPSTNSAPGRPDFEQRSFSGTDLALLLKSPAFRVVVSRFSADSVRPASEKERKAYYFTVPFEIQNDPLDVGVAGDDVLLVVLSEGKVFWLEMVSDWRIGEA